LSGEITGKPPIINVEDEAKLIKVLLELCRNQTINSAHDASEGGLAVCLAEKLFGTDDANNFGCDANLPDSASALFGESHGRVLVSLSSDKVGELESICKSKDVNFWKIGLVNNSGNIKIGESINIDISEIKDLYENAIPKIMNK